jgi:hypothetical protein
MNDSQCARRRPGVVENGGRLDGGQRIVWCRAYHGQQLVEQRCTGGQLIGGQRQVGVVRDVRQRTGGCAHAHREILSCSYMVAAYVIPIAVVRNSSR